MKQKFNKIVKVIGVISIVLFIALIVLFYRFSMPDSDEKILNDFDEENVEVFIKNEQYKGFKYRVLATQKEIDTTLPTIVFIHGAIGSITDFKSYLVDDELNKKANLLAYDRIGYGIYQTGNTQESIAFEVEVLTNITKELQKKNTVLVGYSYGGPIALASKETCKKVILLAPAVFSEVEPMPWALNLYKWNATRWMIPKTWQAASKEKLSHKKDLQNFEKDWNTTTSNVISIHGNKDWIVPYENSLYLKKLFSANQFELVTLDGAGHGLVWSHDDEIKNVILQQLN